MLPPEDAPPPLDRLVPKIAPRPDFLIEAGQGQGGEELRREAPADPREYERRVIGFFDRSLR